jgi:putative RecB family exonuclease
LDTDPGDLFSLFSYVKKVINTNPYIRQQLSPANPSQTAGCGRIQGTVLVENLEFAIAGRYDRLSYVDDGLELVDYKTGKDFKLPLENDVDLQLGLYALAIQQRYQKTLQRCSLMHLKSGEQVTWVITPEQQQHVMQVIQGLALKLRYDSEWVPQEGDHCQQCGYRRYCPALQDEPEQLPYGATAQRGLQLALSF